MTAVTHMQPSKAPLWRRFMRFWFAFEPTRHAWWETVIMRAIFAWSSWSTIGGASKFASTPHPHGMATWGEAFSFTWLGNQDLMNGTVVPLLAVCLILFTLDGIPFGLAAKKLKGLPGLLLGACDRVMRFLPSSITLIPPLVVSVGKGVLGNSQGAIGHAFQIVTTVFLVLWLAAVWSSISALRKRSLPNQFNRYQLAIDWSRQAIAATYVVSALTKLYESKGNWIADAPYFGLQITKATSTGFYDHLAPRMDSDTSALAQFFIDHPLVAQISIGGALPLELFVVLALLNRRIALVYGLLLYVMHSTITQVMQLGFLYHKIFLLALFVNLPWWIVYGVRRLMGHQVSTSGKPAPGSP